MHRYTPKYLRVFDLLETIFKMFIMGNAVKYIIARVKFIVVLTHLYVFEFLAIAQNLYSPRVY